MPRVFSVRARHSVDEHCSPPHAQAIFAAVRFGKIWSAAMLILSRRRGQSIRINERITVRVLTIRPRMVELGIEAPAWVQVDREEIYQQKRLNGRNGHKPVKAS
jgi:carbon storage regulator